MERVLGIDYGGKRIGVAVADLQTRIASPYAVLDGRNDPASDARTVTDFGVKEEAKEFVVGLPLNMNEVGAEHGAARSDSKQTALTRKFAEALGRLSKKPVHLQDERLTSYEAEHVMDEAEVPSRKRKGLVDRIAAQKILQAWLDGLGDESGRI